ncbi:uncharacterized protein TRUGW13939_04150 [Talaromyces rugulosus]|uniref:Uncharacterized protein n=1 Tax=Talaromyces rugulosus TaxID=121627 RepID=A0A7H8QSW4_TALRU|nr:uncharacterized protein TRUGW13939_04150 [Talaromyces rugulosus]QKX57042.1 hypothetical protein TRUGW13939_04150 [Talaromyces rugulosus]
MPKRRRPSVEDYAVGWICALPIELAAAMEMLDETYDSFENGGSSRYNLGRINEHNVVVACLPKGQMGTNSAATVAAELKSSFPAIRFGVLVGIGGGVPSADADIRLGDVVVSLPGKMHGGVIQYDFGKSTPNGLERTGFLNAPPALLLEAVARVQASHIRGQDTQLREYISHFNRVPAFSSANLGQDVLFDANYRHIGGSTCEKCSKERIMKRGLRNNDVVIHYGLIASGNRVIKDGAERDRVASELEGVLCFEMEAAGMMNTFPCLVIRGICDYADSHKNKEWQPYAAAMAAAYTKDLLSVIPPAAVAQTRTMIENLREKQVIEETLNRLPCAVEATFNSYRRQHERTCLVGTRVHVLEEINNWSKKNDNQSIFWLNGWAGTGKSTIAGTIARQYYDEQRLGATFFFSRGGGDVGHAGKFVTTIARQLASNILPLQQFVCEAVASYSAIGTQSLGDQWRHLILNPLSKMGSGSGSPSYLVVIDALDECDDDKGIQVILGLLTETHPAFSNILKVLITSRPNIPIEVGFSHIPPANHRAFILHHLPSEIISHDIVFFLQHELQTIAQDQALEPAWPGAEAIEHLATRASGLFIWCATACRFIKEGDFYAEERLNSLLKGSTLNTAPEERLNEIYMSVLRAAILSTYTEQEKEKLYDHLRHVLGTIVILYSPLHLESMCKLIQVPKQRAAKMLVRLHAILDVSDDLTGPLRLHHPSFRDFLVDNHRCRDPDFLVDKRRMHHQLAANCMKLMSSTLRQDICGVNAPGTSADDIDETQKQQCLVSEIQYACLYWVQHLQDSNVLLKDGDAIHQFLIDHVLHWLEALSWMRRVSEGIRALLSLESLASKSKCPQVNNLIWDAKRLARVNQSIMEKSPLQIYFSALVFAPSTSPIRSRFSHVPMQWISKLPTIRTHWSSLQQTLECNPDRVLHITFSPDGTVLASTSGQKVRLWDPSSGQCLNTLQGQDELQTLDDEVDERDFSNLFSTIAFSPNGKALASASPAISRVWLWDVLTGQCLQVLHGHTRAVNQVAFSYNGDILASSSYDQTVRLWDPCTGNCLQILTGHTDCVRALAFSPVPRFANILASVSDDDSILIWDSTTAKCLQDIKTNDEESRVLAFSCDGEILASAYGDKSNIHHSDASKIQLWNPITGKSLHILQGHSDKVTAIAFSPNGKILASASWDGSVRLWDPLNGHCLAILQHYDHVYDVAFAPDGKTLASATSHNDSVWLWDPLTRQCLQTMEGHSSWVHSVAFSPSLNNSEKLLASAALDDRVILWSTSAEQAQEIAPNESDIFRYFCPLPSGKKLVLLNDTTIQIWDLSTGQWLQTVDYHKSVTIWPSISPNGKIVLITDPNQILIWNPSNGERLQTFSAHAIKSFHFSPNGEKIGLITADNQIMIWNPSNGERLQTVSAHAIRSFRFSPNGEKIVLITDDNQTLVWNPSNGESLQPLNAHKRWIGAATFSPDGEKFASLSVDSMLQICDMSTGRCLQILQTSVSGRYHGYGFTITFCPDGLYVASSSGETAQLWDVSTGQCLQTLEGHINAISVMAFSHDGRLLASASGDPGSDWAYSRSNADNNTLRLWNPFTGQCIHILHDTPGIENLSFSSDDHYLNTSLGVLSLGSVIKSTEANHDTKPQTHGIFIKNSWITWNGQNHFWLPPEYRPQYTAVYDNAVAIVTGDHRMIFFNFTLQ